MIGWNFPSNNYGQITGLNDAGIETFRGNPWDSLAREINQNSCDARIPDSIEPVRVEFEVMNIPSSDFPAKEAYIKMLQESLKYWSDNAKTVAFFKNAVDVMNAEEIKFLKISDYNTTGLTGANQGRQGGWHNLIKSVGSSNKDSKAGGSFGIGKHAPFACSDLRTVFYSTMDTDGVEAFQGVAKLVTHSNDQGEPTQGTGYYGEAIRNEPILQRDRISEMFRRNEVGTDVFIAGFHAEGDWETKVIRSVLESFLVAILDQKLIVKVGSIEINAETLPSILENYTKNEAECLSYPYYEAYTLSNASKFVLENFEGMGEVRMHVLPGKDAPKRVAMVRSTGMKIYDKGSFRTPFKFAGVLIAEGDEINKFLRQIEPPTHTAWEADRHDDPKYAKAVIKKLYAWMNDKIRSITPSDSSEELDVEGLSDYLPDQFDDFQQPIPSLSESEGEKAAPKEIQMQTNDRKSKPNTQHIMNEGDFPSYEQDMEEEEEEYTSPGLEVEGKHTDENPDSEGDKESDGSEEDGDSSSNDNEPDKGEEGPADIEDKAGSLQPETEKKLEPKAAKNLRITQSRIFCIDPAAGKYRVTMQSNEDGYGYVGINILGEVGGEKAKVRAAEQLGEPIDIENEIKLGPVLFDKKDRTVLTITLKDPLRCALEVAVYAN
ncbi:hypothetical protein CDO73_01260 [Saccharibacillus sp. O23]|uniref:hypothetical protein n=1 Tax=Saccharibacillus sp. O23 TaxID=2009338 RepID=UPI000B4E2194|nr:hypothetical protein [Saccharibacillus sp. O23]OWR33161.1 hypothetical protein CDO73_01260 [Saccharibacillus sp. O23]